MKLHKDSRNNWIPYLNLRIKHYFVNQAEEFEGILMRENGTRIENQFQSGIIFSMVGEFRREFGLGLCSPLKDRCRRLLHWLSGGIWRNFDAWEWCWNGLGYVMGLEGIAEEVSEIRVVRLGHLLGGFDRSYRQELFLFSLDNVIVI